MLRCFGRVAFWLCVLTIYVSSIATEVPQDSLWSDSVSSNLLLNLFVQNEVEIPLPSTNDSAAAKKYAILQQEYEKRDLLRSAMESALLQDRYDDFKTIVLELFSFLR